MSQQPEYPCPAAHYSSPTEPTEFSSEERAILLQLAHDAILASLENRTIPLDPPSSHLAEPYGVFTTLYLTGRVRGCRGCVFPVSSVYGAMAETAAAASFEEGH